MIMGSKYGLAMVKRLKTPMRTKSNEFFKEVNFLISLMEFIIPFSMFPCDDIYRLCFPIVFLGDISLNYYFYSEKT